MKKVKKIKNIEKHICQKQFQNITDLFFFAKRDYKTTFHPSLASEISRHHGGALLNFFHASPMIYLVRTHSLLGYVVVVVVIFLLLLAVVLFSTCLWAFPSKQAWASTVFVFAVAAASSRTTATCVRTERIFWKVCSSVELFLARRRSIFSRGANRVGNFPLLVCAWVRVMCFLSRLITIDRRFAESLR